MPMARSAAGRVFFSGSTSTFQEREIVALDAPTLQIKQRWRLSDLETTSLVPGVELLSLSSVALAANGQALFLAPARQNGNLGFALFDLMTERVSLFRAGLVVANAGILALPPVNAFPKGVIAAAVGRSMGNGLSEGWMYLLDPATMLALDSARVTTVTPHPHGGISGIYPHQSADKIYLATQSRLFLIDLASLSLTDSIAIPRGARVFPSATQRLLVTDAGDNRDDAGSGFVIAYSPDLKQADSLSLRHSAVGGFGPTVQAAAWGPAGSQLFALVGNPAVGPLFPSQSLKLLVIDPSTGQLLRQHDLPFFGGGMLLVQ